MEICYCTLGKEKRMNKIDFEGFLHEYFCENNPSILDDNLPDATSDWIADLDCEEFIRLGDLYAKKLLNAPDGGVELDETKIWDILTKIICDNDLDRTCSPHESKISWLQADALADVYEALKKISVEEVMPKETVVCAAVKLKNGKIYLGHRHGDCFNAAKAEGQDLKGSIQGFITTNKRFVTREEGRKLQDAAGIPSVEGYRGDTLFSEDLY